MRDACAVADLTTAELALIPAATALAGVALGTGGTAWLDRLRERRAARDQRDRAIAELLTAAVDLISGAQVIRAAYEKQGGWRYYARASAAVLTAAGEVLGPGGTLSAEILVAILHGCLKARTLDDEASAWSHRAAERAV